MFFRLDRMGYDFSPSMFVYGPSKHWLAQRWWATHDRCKWPPSYGRSQSWLLLTDLLEPNMGSLMVVPGSRRIQGRPPSMPQARYPIGAVELKLKAGDAVIFQHGVFHAGASNLSDQTRIAL